MNIQEIKTWWSHLSTREQKLLSIGIIFFGVLLFYLLIIHPISSSLNTKHENIAAQKKLLSWMQISVPQLQALRSGNTSHQTITSGSLLASVEQSIKQSAIANSLTTLEKNPDDTANESVQIKFDKVSFDNLMTWLISFWQSYNVTISQMTINRLNDAGMVQASLTLSL